jgi:hypothetical protein
MQDAADTAEAGAESGDGGSSQGGRTAVSKENDDDYDESEDAHEETGQGEGDATAKAAAAARRRGRREAHVRLLRRLGAAAEPERPLGGAGGAGIGAEVEGAPGALIFDRVGPLARCRPASIAYPRCVRDGREIRTKAFRLVQRRRALDYCLLLAMLGHRPSSQNRPYQQPRIKSPDWAVPRRFLACLAITAYETITAAAFYPTRIRVLCSISPHICSPGVVLGL